MSGLVPKLIFAIFRKTWAVMENSWQKKFQQNLNVLRKMFVYERLLYTCKYIYIVPVDLNNPFYLKIENKA